jgi:hypothetical protein
MWFSGKVPVGEFDPERVSKIDVFLTIRQTDPGEVFGDFTGEQFFDSASIQSIFRQIEFDNLWPEWTVKKLAHGHVAQIGMGEAERLQPWEPFAEHSHHGRIQARRIG